MVGVSCADIQLSGSIATDSTGAQAPYDLSGLPHYVTGADPPAHWPGVCDPAGPAIPPPNGTVPRPSPKTTPSPSCAMQKAGRGRAGVPGPPAPGRKSRLGGEAGSQRPVPSGHALPGGGQDDSWHGGYGHGAGPAGGFQRPVLPGGGPSAAGLVPEARLDRKGDMSI